MKAKEKPVEEKKEEPVKMSKWEKQLDKNLVPVGWVLLLVMGLAHLLPVQLEPVLKWSVAGVTLQGVVGAIGIAVALNFLFRE